MKDKGGNNYQKHLKIGFLPPNNCFLSDFALFFDNLSVLVIKLSYYV